MCVPLFACAACVFIQLCAILPSGGGGHVSTTTAKILNSSPPLGPLVLPFIAEHLPSGPTPALTPGSTDLSSVSLTVINGITQYVPFGDWLSQHVP